MEVIPSLNCHFKDSACAKEGARVAEGFSEWIHLDVADGRFTFNKTWGSPAEWRALGSKLKLEVHLMIEEPEKQILDWIEAGAERIIVHAETLSAEAAEKIEKLGKEHAVEMMLAFSPETRLETAREYFKRFSEYQILAVYPGLPNQIFLPIVLEKIRFLRESFPKSNIEVDGGINLETARAVKAAGANILISASHIFKAKDPKAAYEELLAV